MSELTAEEIRIINEFPSLKQEFTSLLVRYIKEIPQLQARLESAENKLNLLPPPPALDFILKGIQDLSARLAVLESVRQQQISLNKLFTEGLSKELPKIEPKKREQRKFWL